LSSNKMFLLSGGGNQEDEVIFPRVLHGMCALKSVFADADLRARLAAGATVAAAALPDWPTAVSRWVVALDRLAT
jgi:hypothetical protein